MLTQTALAAEVGEWGRVFVSMALLLFVFTTLVYNYYLGENALGFFSQKRWLVQVYRVLVMALVLWGSMQDLSTVFGFADVTMGLLALVNLAALFMLFKVGLRPDARLRQPDPGRRAKPGTGCQAVCRPRPRPAGLERRRRSGSA